MIIKHPSIIDTNLTEEEVATLKKASEIFLKIHSELNVPLTLTSCSGSTPSTRARITTEELFKIGDFLDTFGRYHYWYWD